MEAITYLRYPQEITKVNAKPAKMAGMEKLKNLKNKYDSMLSTLLNTEMRKPVVKPEVTVTPTVSPVIEPNVEEVKVSKPTNYAAVMQSFSMAVYGDSFQELPLSSARKIRVNTRVKKHVVGLRDTFGTSKIVHEIPKKEPYNNVSTFPSRVSSNVAINDEVVNKEVVTQPLTRTTAKYASPVAHTETIVKENTPSVDDYLQKEVPIAESGLINELSSDILKLKGDVKQRTELLEQLEAQYNDIQTQKAKRIKELEEEKLSYTTMIEGLTDKIKNLQNAILKERQTLESSNDDYGSRRIA